MAARLLVNSAMTLGNSKGDLIVASLWANSKANCMLACAISSSFACVVRLSPDSQQEEPLVLSRYDASGAIQSGLPQPTADACLSDF
jgi:hypothetical protein